MSGIRFCDRHHGPFPSGQEGSSKFTGIIQRRYESGEAYEEHVSWDFCPACTALMQSPKAGQPDYAKIQQLELGLGLAPSDPPSTRIDWAALANDFYEGDVEAAQKLTVNAAMLRKYEYIDYGEGRRVIPT